MSVHTEPGGIFGNVRFQPEIFPGVSIPQAVISWLQQYHAGSRVALEMM